MNPFVQYTFTFCRVDSLAMGGLVAVLLRNGRWPWSPTATARLALAVAAIVVVGEALGDAGWKADFNRTVGFTIICSGFALLLAWTMFHLGDRCTNVLRFAPLTYLGQISYGLYMLHLPAAQATRMVIHRVGLDSLPIELRTLAAVVAAIGAATVSWYAFERPILRLKSLFQSREVQAVHS